MAGETPKADPITTPPIPTPGIEVINPMAVLNATREIAEPIIKDTAYGAETTTKVVVRYLSIFPDSGATGRYNHDRDKTISWDIMSKEDQAIFQAAIDKFGELVERSLKQ